MPLTRNKCFTRVITTLLTVSLVGFGVPVSALAEVAEQAQGDAAVTEGDQSQVQAQMEAQAETQAEQQPETQDQQQTDDLEDIATLEVQDDASAAAAEARAYVEKNVIGASYFMTNATRGSDGIFTLAAKTSYGYDVSDLILNTSGDSNGTYVYDITCGDAALRYYRLRNEMRWYFSVEDRPADRHVISLSLNVYAAGTARAAIDAGTATAITTVPVQVVLEPAPAKYQVTFSPVDATTGAEIPGASLEVREVYSWGDRVYAGSDGAYTLDSSKTYYVKASASGYSDATITDFKPSESGATTLKLTPKVADAYTVSVTDAKTGKPIKDATVKVTYSRGYYATGTVEPQVDDTYRLEQGTTYTVSASADGYKSADSQKVTPEATGVAVTGNVSFSLAPITYTNVSFRAVDPAGNPVDDAGAPTVKDGTSWDADTVSPQADGSYRLEVGSTASVTYSVAHYKSTAVSYVVTGEEYGPADIALAPKENVLTVRVLKAKGVEDADAKVTVTHEEEDYWSDEPETKTDRSNADGTYSLALPYSSWSKPTTYTITVTGSNGVSKTETFTPSADSVYKTLTVRLYDDPDQAKADAAAKAIDGMYALRPHYGIDANINNFVAGKVGNAAEGATISLASTSDASVISRDGVIHYAKAKTSQWGPYSKNVDLVFLVTMGDCTAVAKGTATVGWDADWYHQQMQTEADGLNISSLLGRNVSADEVTDSLVLPEYAASSVRNSYSAIAWTADPTGVVDTTTGAVTRGSTDQRVTLTATFSPNDVLLNDYVDDAKTIGTVTRTFMVTVKADPEKVAAESARLQQMLDDGFTYGNVTVSGSGEAIAADGTGITDDLQMPTTRRFRDTDGSKLDGKYYSVTYSTPEGSGVTPVAYRLDVVRPLGQSRVVPVTCTITSKENPEITASKTLAFTVDAVSEAELDAEVSLMEQAEEGFKAALLNGQAEPVAKNLSTFYELYANANGSLGVARNVTAADKVHGIVTCDVDGYDPMGSYDQARTFKSNNTDVVLNESLQLAWNADWGTMLSPYKDQPLYNTKIQVTSKLASERYASYYDHYKDDPSVDTVLLAKLKRLAPHDVSAIINVAGTTGKEAPASYDTPANGRPVTNETEAGTTQAGNTAGTSTESANEAGTVAQTGAVVTSLPSGGLETDRPVHVKDANATSGDDEAAESDSDGETTAISTSETPLASDDADRSAHDVQLPVWPIVGMCIGVAVLLLAVLGRRRHNDEA